MPRHAHVGLADHRHRVVEREPGADVRALPAAVRERVEERHRPDQVRRQPGEQQAALLERLADQPEVEHLEVAQAAVDQLAAAAAGAAGQVALLQQAGVQAPGDGVERGADADDAAADDEDVELTLPGGPCIAASASSRACGPSALVGLMWPVSQTLAAQCAARASSGSRLQWTGEETGRAGGAHWRAGRDGLQPRRRRSLDDRVRGTACCDPRRRPRSPDDPRPRAEPRGPEPRTASLVMGGDLLWHNTVWFSAAEDHARTGAGDRYDFDPMFAALKPTHRATPTSRSATRRCRSRRRARHRESTPSSPRRAQIAPWIASMGWDACTTASNHSGDQGFDGVVTTADLLERERRPARRHLPHRAPSAGSRSSSTTDDGVRVGVVAGTYGLNGFVMPEDEGFGRSRCGTPTTCSTRRTRARRRAPTSWSCTCTGATSTTTLPNAEQVALAERLTASPDVDLVLGEHAHVVQPITKVNGKWVVYGMGNMIAQNEVDPGRHLRGHHRRLRASPSGATAASR